MDFADFSLDDIFPASGSDPLASLDDVLTLFASDPVDSTDPGGNLSNAPRAPPDCEVPCPAKETKAEPEAETKEDKAARTKKARENAMLRRARRRETDALARKRRADHIAGLEAENKRLRGENDQLRAHNAVLVKRTSSYILPLPAIASTM